MKVRGIVFVTSRFMWRPFIMFQVIHYLTRLTKQWDKILPVHIFKQSIAILFNTVLENILTAIFKMEVREIFYDFLNPWKTKNFNPFHAAGHFLYLLKTSENQVSSCFQWCIERDQWHEMGYFQARLLTLPLLIMFKISNFEPFSPQFLKKFFFCKR